MESLVINLVISAGYIIAIAAVMVASEQLKSGLIKVPLFFLTLGLIWNLSDYMMEIFSFIETRDYRVAAVVTVLVIIMLPLVLIGSGRESKLRHREMVKKYYDWRNMERNPEALPILRKELDWADR